MCGIAGFSLSEKEGRVNARKLSKELLLGIEDRGRQATGAAFIDNQGHFQVHKAPVTAKDFVRERLFVARDARTVVLHTRLPTGAPTSNPLNNHPIISGHIAGVHNGWVNNDDDIFEVIGKDKRRAEVDSEAIFAAIAYGEEHPMEALKVVRGPAAVAWLDRKEGPKTLQLARADSSPLWMAYTDNGSTIFASEQQAVEAAAFVAGLNIVACEALSEGRYVKIVEGVPTAIEKFEPNRSYTNWRTSRGYSYSSCDSWADVVDARNVASDTPPSGNRRRRLVTTKTTGVTGGRRVYSSSSYEPRYLSTELFRTEEGTKWLERRNDTHGQRARKASIEDYLKGIRIQNDDNEYERLEALAVLDYHAEAAVGDRVYTELRGDKCIGEILAMPDDFPFGSYYLRCWVENPLRAEGGEWVLTSKLAHEFEEIGTIAEEVEPNLADDAAAREFDLADALGGLGTIVGDYRRELAEKSGEGKE